MDKITRCLQISTALRGFHMYWNTKKVTFTRKLNNHYDQFTVSGKTFLSGKNTPSICRPYST